MSHQISPYLLAIFFGWLIAHTIKILINRLSGKDDPILRELFISGGMPSSHASTTTAIWMVILLRDGIDSGLFGLATMLTVIVCYDAVKVRRSVGEQGVAIAELIKATKSKIKKPRSARGHTPLEVAAGAVLGVTIGCIVFFATK